MAQGFFKNIMAVSGTNAFNTLINVATGILIARFLGPDGKGLYTSLLVVPTMILSLSELGIRRSTIHHIGDKKYPAQQIISALAFFFLFTSIVGVTVTAFVYRQFDPSTLTLTMILLALFSIPIRLINKFSGGILVAEERFKISNMLSRIPVVADLVFVVLFLIILKMSVTGALIALVISNVISAIYGLLIIGRKYKLTFSFNLEIMKSLLSLGIIYAIALFLARLNFKIDILLLKELASDSEVGFYSLGANIAEKWQSPFAVGAVILASSANAKDQAKVNQDVSRLFRMTLLFAVVVSSGIFILAPFLVPIVYSKAFIPSIPIVQYILPAIVLLISGKLLASRIAGLKKTHYIIYIHLPALIVNVVLNILFIPKYGAMGAVFATNISYSLTFIGTLWIYCHITKTSFFSMFRFTREDLRFGKLFKLRKRKKKLDAPVGEGY
ncbi:MAG: flippase [Bacteroidales bacterium]|nr:flippase [Bacteroidales bacterium]MCF8456781.1 flippase [Bacteroidales bacterium]